MDIVGPTINVLFNETPFDVLADASNTARNFVVVLESFPHYVHRKIKHRTGGSLRHWLCMPHVKVFVDDGFEFREVSLRVNEIAQTTNSMFT